MAVELCLTKGYQPKTTPLRLLSEYTEILKTIQLYSNDAIVILNEKKQIIMLSDKFYTLFNVKNVIGENFNAIMKEIIRLPEDFFKEKIYFISMPCENENKVIKANIEYLKNDTGQIIRYILILKDITEHADMQAQKDNFIATLTHDLKTPVRADILSLELLLKGHFGKLNKKQTEIITEMLNSDKFLMNMLDTLLAKYKYENDGVILVKTDFMLNEFVENTVKDLKCLFQEKQLTCQCNYTEKDIKIFADKIELKRALSNILCNAIKFNKYNGNITVTLFTDENNAGIRVEDNGIGMSKDKLEHIFDKYVSYAKRFRRLGTGLGLYVSKKIVEAHSGKIEVSSIYKKGSVFTILLPLSELNQNFK